METKKLIKSLFVAGLFMGVLLLGTYQFFYPPRDPSFGWKIPTNKFQPSGQVTDSSAYSFLREQGGTPRGLPVRLRIPIISVDTAIEDAYITSDGRMDVPAGSVNVAWYALGPSPGKIGSAVIGGHFGIDNGKPKVFYNLSKLTIGDKLYIVDDQGKNFAFVVRSIRLFDRNADADSVFFSSDGLAHLNLITCEGEWNKVNDTYPDRRVVFADAVPSEDTMVVVKKPSPITLQTSFPVTDTISPTATLTPKTSTTPTPSPVSSPTPKSLSDSSKYGLISAFIILLLIFIIFKTHPLK